MGELGPNLSAVEAVVAQVATALAPEAAAEFAERARAEDPRVGGPGLVVHDEAAIVDEAVAVDGVEDVRVHVVRVCRDDDTAGEELLGQAEGARAEVLEVAPLLVRAWVLLKDQGLESFPV